MQNRADKPPQKCKCLSVFVMVHGGCLHIKNMEAFSLWHASLLNLNHYHHTTTIKYIIAGAITSYHIIKLLFKMTDHS